MALRNSKLLKIKDWLGLNTFATTSNLGPGWWTEAINMMVTNDGSSQVFTGGFYYSDALSIGSFVSSGFGATLTSGGNLILFDISNRTYAIYLDTNATLPVLLQTSAIAPVFQYHSKYLTTNDRIYRLNGHQQQFQTTDGVNIYNNGITAPTSRPILTFTGGGAGSVTSGVTASYAYRNSSTGQVSAPSPVSATSGLSGASNSIQITSIAASTETGVDQIVYFFTQDGGAVRYLYTDATGTPITGANAATTVTISNSLLVNLDTLTPETSYNWVPPNSLSVVSGRAIPYFMFRYKDRLCLCDFRSGPARQQVQYNVYENCYYGVPWESWWPLNAINIPNKEDSARCGIETPIGALILGERDAYMIRGDLTDKISAPESSISVTEHMQAMGWSIGTRSPHTLVSTPFGEIWLDQNKRVQLWKRDGFPIEIGLPIRTSLAAIRDTDAARNFAQGLWFQHGDTGGLYLLAASIYTNTEQNTTMDLRFALSIYRDPEDGQLRTAWCTPATGGECLFTASISGKLRCFAGVSDRIIEIFEDPTTTNITTFTPYFRTIIGNDDEYCYWHSLRFHAPFIGGLQVSIADLDGSNSKILELEQEGEFNTAPWYAVIDDYGFQKVLSFRYDALVYTSTRAINNLRVAYSPTSRII